MSFLAVHGAELAMIKAWIEERTCQRPVWINLVLPIEQLVPAYWLRVEAGVAHRWECYGRE